MRQPLSEMLGTFMIIGKPTNRLKVAFGRRNIQREWVQSLYSLAAFVVSIYNGLRLGFADTMEVPNTSDNKCSMQLEDGGARK